MKRLRGLKDLVVDGVQEVSGLVERAEQAAGARVVRWMAPVAPLDRVAQGVVLVRDAASALTHATIRGVAQGVRVVGDASLDLTTALQPPDAPPPAPAPPGPVWLDVVEGAVNGVLGDHLASRNNGLDLGMTLRVQGQAIALDPASIAAALPAPSSTICVFVHGLSATEHAWAIHAEAFWGEPGVTFGAKLEQELGLTALYVRYNSGRHIATNGAALAELLAGVAASWPSPIERLVLIGHSMGGLVARAAVAHADAHRDAHALWLDALTDVFCLGSPHHGAPLEKFAHTAGHVLGAIDTTWTRVSAEVLSARSAGIRDLRVGRTADAGMPCVANVRYTALATTLTRDPDHPLGVLLGDWLVRLPSATGQGAREDQRIPFHSTHVIPGMGHNDLANHPEVYAALRGWLA